MHFHGLLLTLFGPGTWGTGGNMVAWVICGVFGLGWLHAKEKARHLVLLQHHQAQIELMKQQHAELMAHVTATAKAS